MEMYKLSEIKILWYLLWREILYSGSYAFHLPLRDLP